MDIVALVAVAASYANCSLPAIMQALSVLEGTMVRVEEAYAEQRTELQEAVGAPLERALQGLKPAELKVAVVEPGLVSVAGRKRAVGAKGKEKGKPPPVGAS